MGSFVYIRGETKDGDEMHAITNKSDDINTNNTKTGQMHQTIPREKYGRKRRNQRHY